MSTMETQPPMTSTKQHAWSPATSNVTPPIRNPHSRCPTDAPTAGTGQEMGPQSQRRLTSQERTHKLSASANKKRKTGQLTLLGEAAFDPLEDCVVCKARAFQFKNIPHRGHHKLCPNNRRTRGVTSTTALKQAEIDKALKQHFKSPSPPAAKVDWRHSTVQAGAEFFAPRVTATSKKEFASPTKMTSQSQPSADSISPEDFCKAVTERLKDASFVTEHANEKHPLAMAALAGFVNEKIIRSKKIRQHFQGIAFTVPGTTDDSVHGSPHHHSIVGQKLLLVDWVRTFGLSTAE